MAQLKVLKSVLSAIEGIYGQSAALSINLKYKTENYSKLKYQLTVPLTDPHPCYAVGLYNTDQILSKKNHFLTDSVLIFGTSSRVFALFLDWRQQVRDHATLCYSQVQKKDTAQLLHNNLITLHIQLINSIISYT